jgi:hypothetical protein
MLQLVTPGNRKSRLQTHDFCRCGGSTGRISQVSLCRAEVNAVIMLFRFDFHEGFHGLGIVSRDEQGLCFGLEKA